jgi:hypothetical protein
MRLVLGFGKRIWMLENSTKVVKIVMESKSDEESDADTDVIGMDPHGTLSAHTEISGSGIDLNGWRFGFSAPVTADNGNGSEG